MRLLGRRRPDFLHRGVKVAIKLVIKGTPDDARKAAKLRGVPLQEVKRGEHGCTTARTGARFAKVVWDWWHARDGAATRDGYPPGTLLVYRER